MSVAGRPAVGISSSLTLLCKAFIGRSTTVLVTNILAVYRGYPVMVVAETEEGVLLELSLNELADVYELLPPAL